MSEQTPKEIAESILRSHDEFCIGHVKEDEPWCSTVDAPFCPACQKLVDAIESALSARCTALEAQVQEEQHISEGCEQARFAAEARCAALEQERDYLTARCEALTAERDKWKARTEQLANFNPNWDLPEASQDILREHMGIIKDLRTRCQHLEQAVRALKPLEDRATEYLSLGGFFNPELMEHRKVSELLMNTRNALAALASLLPSQDGTDQTLKAFSEGYTQALDDALKGKP